MYRISGPKRRKICDEVLELVDLGYKREALVTSLSRGMTQRLGLARVLLHDPQVLLLDEPASGLDPRARIEIRGLLKELRNMGKTIMVSSHILPELADICNKIGIIERGELLVNADVDDVMKQGFSINIGGCFRGGPPSYFAPYRIPTLPEKEAGEYLPQRLADEAISFVRKNHGKPFFLNWWPYSVHYPMQAREVLIAKYRKRKGPGIRNPTYAAMIEGMDTEIGRFLKALDDAGLRDNTLVTFKSDNGGYNGDNRPLRGFKGTLYEGGIRIPWIVRWPGKVKPGSTCATPVISMDCYPTLLDVAGLPPTPDHPVDGKSLLPLFEQSGRLDRDAVYLHYPNYAFHKKNRLGGVIREGEYKLIKRYRDGELELYHLNSDIGEKKNLAAQSPELAGFMERKLEAWLRETGAKMPVRSAP